MTSPLFPRGLVVALQLLTRLPTPRLADHDGADLAGAAPYLPLVGAIVGVVVACAAWLFGHVSPLVGALGGLVAWAWVTGAVHLDGLGDVADALGAAHKEAGGSNSERFHAVLSDPHAGSFAVVAIGLVIAAKLALLASLPLVDRPLPLFAALVLVPAWARWGALVASRSLPSLKAGLGRSFAANGGAAMPIGWAVVLAAASACAAPVLLVALPLAGALVLYWRWRLGGVTGDCLGAGIEVTESLLLLALAVGARVGAPLLW